MKPMHFGALFLGIRERLGMTQVEMAKRLGIVQSTLSKIERELIEPCASTYVRILRLQLHDSLRGQPHIRSICPADGLCKRRKPP